jgi:hypothetical protein
MSKLEEKLAFQMKAIGLRSFVREHRFAAEHVGMGKGLRDRLAQARLRDWRFDMAIPELKIAIEVEGGGWTGGRHTRGKGFSEDLRKYGEAMKLGWNIYRCDGALIDSGCALETIVCLIKSAQKA